MQHTLKLHSKPFEAIKSGRKDIEMRLFDDKRKTIKVGDEILLVNRANGERLKCIVTNLFLFDNFLDLYKCFDKSRLGYKDDEAAYPSDMEQYYQAEEIRKYKVIAIEIKRAER